MKKAFVIIAAVCLISVSYFFCINAKNTYTSSDDAGTASETISYATTPATDTTYHPQTTKKPTTQTAVSSKEETIKETSDKELHELKVHFIDVGQGDSTLIQCNNSTLLIDAGGESKGSKLRYYLAELGIDKLDYVISTHPDSDHIGSMDVILQNFTVNTYFQPDIEVDTKQFEQLMYSLKYKSLKITPPEVGNTYILGDASFTIIAPNDDYGNSTNDWSIGILLVHGSNKFVFCGDCEKTAEADILKNGIDIDADVFKLSHHGSNTANTKEFIEAISPDSCVVCCGKDNPYGHPHAEVTDMLGKMGIDIYRTDKQGTVIAYSDGKSITFNNAPYTVDITENPASLTEPPETTPEPSTSKDDTPVTADYVLNTNTKKFHLPTCSSVEDIKVSNKRFFSGVKEEILAMGYSPCKRCEP